MDPLNQWKILKNLSTKKKLHVQLHLVLEKTRKILRTSNTSLAKKLVCREQKLDIALKKVSL